jgi:toxin ParE1/3/4
VTYRYAVGEGARADIRDILIRSQDDFGSDIRDGYEELIFTAFSDIADAPAGVGVKDRSELGEGLRTWHLALSRDHVGDDVRRIAVPRHIVFFRVVGEVVQIARLLHESMDPGLHRLA